MDRNEVEMMHSYPYLTPEARLALLAPPTGPISMVLDTDTYNEIDDQFALVYALLSPNLQVEAIYAAPFHNERSTGPADGMEKSYEEILRILERLSISPDGLAWRGAMRYLPSLHEPVSSPATEDLIARARMPRQAPLYVLAIGAITNVASALLLAPDITDKIVVVWLGGHPYYWENTVEFNLKQDVAAAQVVFDCGVPLVHIPCYNVAEHLRTTLVEIGAFVRGKGAIGDYLYRTFETCHDDHFAYSRVIWDISTVAYVNSPAWVSTTLCPSPLLRDDITWGSEEVTRHLVRVAQRVNRDAIFRDLFRKLASHA